jgi:hypothetical protein
MMNAFTKFTRAAATAITASAFLVMPLPALAHEEDDHGCAQFARVSCQNDGDYTFQCFEQRHQECLDFFHGTASYDVKLDWLST